MKALVTGASSGIGRDLVRVLDANGFEVILVARSKDEMITLSQELTHRAQVIVADLSKDENCYALHQKLADQSIDLLVNNAGFGVFGQFSQTKLEDELALIAVNIKAVHILTKLFLADFQARNSGCILNVASSAAFLPGPLMAAYYASKAYILRLSQSIYEELRQEKSGVQISVLCPGPVQTNFNKRANVQFAVKGLDSHFVAQYTIQQLQKGKFMIIPGHLTRIGASLTKLLPDRFLAVLAYHFQKRKNR